VKTAAVVLGGVLLCAPGMARAEPLFPLFKTFCSETRAEPKAALAAADKASWSPIKKSMIAAFKLGGSEVTDADGRMTTTPDGFEAMIVAHAKESGLEPGHEASICAVAFSMADLAAVKAEAAEFAAVEASPGAIKDGSATVYAWRDKDGRRERVVVSDIEAIPNDPNISILMAGSAGAATLLAFIVPSK